MTQVEAAARHPLLGAPPRRGYTKLFSGSIEQLLRPPSGQIPFLDGLRTIAILLVINHHFSAGFAEVYGDNLYSRLPFVINGWSGVDLFFVLSGFFIGGQLWKELQKDGTISIRGFILRRGLRIWPLFFFIFACVFVIYWPDAAAKQYGWTDVAFVTNYISHGIVGGGWSLCTEEQFYIVTPLLLYFFRRNKVDTMRPWLWAILALIPLMRAVIWVSHTGSFFHHDPALFATMYYKFHTHCDGLVIGLIISNLWVSRDKPRSSFKKASLILCCGFILLVLLRTLQHEIFIFTGLALFFGALVWFGLTARVNLFSSRPFYWLSRLSFGMYLNHAYLVGPVMTHFVEHLHLIQPSSIAAQICGTIVLTSISGAIALVTFCVVEHPFLRLRMQLLDPAHA
jgi:peptidoglycan/LPS O-acetylase OafA/YrhL